jgi:hypothetical protein
MTVAWREPWVSEKVMKVMNAKTTAVSKVEGVYLPAYQRI